MNFQFIYLIAELCHAIFCRSCVFHQKYLTMLDKKIPLQFQKINLQSLIIVFGLQLIITHLIVLYYSISVIPTHQEQQPKSHNYSLLK